MQDYDSLWRIVRRHTAQGYSDYSYEGDSDWLVRERWHANSGNTFDLVRYEYTNGRPSRVEIASVSNDLQTLNGYSTSYLQYNWHGDTVVWSALDGSGTNAITLTTDPWGVYTSDTPQYYLWNGAWGYLYFSQLKLYYAHGRWYNPETALWLTPDQVGDYMYGGAGQDPVNYAWHVSGSGFGRTGDQEDEPEYLKTSRYGYIDTNHFHDAQGKARDILDNLRSGKRDFTEWLSFGKGIEGVNLLSMGIRVTYQILKPVDDDLRTAVGLGIFEDLEMRFEMFQSMLGDLHNSGFSIEDLPSDYLGFYSVVTGTDLPAIVKILEGGSFTVLKDYAAPEVIPTCNAELALLSGTNCRAVKNFQFRPKVDQPGVGLANVDWPKELQLPQPIKAGEYWTTSKCHTFADSTIAGWGGIASIKAAQTEWWICSGQFH